MSVRWLGMSSAPSKFRMKKNGRPREGSMSRTDQKDILFTVRWREGMSDGTLLTRLPTPPNWIKISSWPCWRTCSRDRDPGGSLGMVSVREGDASDHAAPGYEALGQPSLGGPTG